MNTIYEDSKKILLKHKGEYIMIFGKKKIVNIQFCNIHIVKKRKN